MIFYDKSQQRRRLIRSSVILMVCLTFVLLTLLLESVYADVTPATVGTLPKLDDMELVLTFDDGPHPVNTEAILEILEEKQVPAAFFFVGSQMLKYPELVRSVDEAGHEIGNHTFTHSEHVHDSKGRLRFELQTTNQIIEYLIGKQPQFYRSPFLLDFSDTTTEFINGSSFSKNHPLYWINELGFISVSAYIDPQDWNLQDSDKLIKQVQARTEHGNIILLHGGWESHTITIEALPTIIDELRARGFHFVSLQELSGFNAYKTEINVVDQSDELAIPILGTIYNHSQPLLLSLVGFVLVLSLLRLIFILLVRLFPTKTKPRSYNDGVSVLIPAYNEAKNIRATITSITNSTHEKIEIIVIDDGSTDTTRDVVHAIKQLSPIPIRYLYKENGGKASALNLGLGHCKYEVIVAIDGDTVIHKDAISHLTSHFNNKKTGAVAGKIIAITDNSLVSYFQDIEYTVNQNLEKIVFSTFFNSINVVPGAIGAWRIKAIEEAGGYSNDTLVEDQDLTLAMHQQGYTVLYEPCAVAFTEVPSNISSFTRQRFRWIFGTIQCLWKYKTSIGDRSRPQLGLIILPYVLLFGVVTPLLMPIVDVLLIYYLITAGWALILAPIIFFIVIDIMYHSFGLFSEPNKLPYLILVPIQRLFYRIIISFVMIMSLTYALEGTRTYWKAQLRTGSAQALFTKHHRSVV